MRKNKMMRLASVLLVAVLLTTSVISGTYAKYVTTASGTDSARVAKWGITMITGTDIFSDKYDSTVASINGDKVVAPGTTNSNIYTVGGTPETAYVITFDGTATKDVFLGAANYTYPAPYAASMSANATELTNPYYPVKYQVQIETGKGLVSAIELGGLSNGTHTFNNLEEAMTALSKTKVKFDANTPCDLKVTITWEWWFDQETGAKVVKHTDHTSVDKFDTILGDLAAMRYGDTVALTTAAEINVNYGLDIAYSLQMTATQID